MTLDPNPQIDTTTSYKNAATRVLTADDADLAYRELGQGHRHPGDLPHTKFIATTLEFIDRHRERDTAQPSGDSA